jgi:alkanesulfonate monooxygenase SsuD/methylene tetrahydromethanopterin reductase-like flavin-dependent oxidoreductase (luciferase family)
VAFRDVTSRGMRFAVGLPNLYAYADPHLLVALARETEAAGWDGLFLWDHLVASESLSAPVVDPWVATAAIAAHTERIEIGIMIVPLARRRPWHVARQGVSLDLLSAGRFRLGVGLGSAHYTEFEALGEDPDPRVRADRVDEGLEILAGLWTGEPFSFDGRYHRIVEAQFLPLATRTPRIPIWVGGTWPNRRPFRRAARWDGVFPTFAGVGHTEMPAAETFGEAVAYTREHRTTRGPFDIALEGQTDGTDAAADAEKVRAYAERGLTWWVEKLGWFRGSVDQMRERIAAGPPAGTGIASPAAPSSERNGS